MNTVLTNQPEPQTAFAGAQRAAKYIEDQGSQEPNPPALILEDRQTVESESVAPVDLKEIGELAAMSPPRIARLGLRGALARVGIRLVPGATEKQALAVEERLRRDSEIIRQATWTRAVGVLVANPKGGVGKTPTAVLLGGTLASIRGGSVCVLEVADDSGALTFRTEGRPSRGLGELIHDIAEIRSAGQLAGYTAPQTSFAAVIGSVGARPQLSGEQVAAVAGVVDDYFAIRVMDSGNQASSSAFQTAVSLADVLVIPIFDAGDAALEAAALLDTLKGAGGKAAELAKTAVILRMHDGRPENPQVVARVDRILGSYGVVRIHSIPFDSHVAERGQLTLENLSAETRRAFVAASADVVRSLKEAVR